MTRQLKYCSYCRYKKTQSEFTRNSTIFQQCNKCRKTKDDWYQLNYKKRRVQKNESMKKNWATRAVQCSRDADKKKNRYPVDDSQFITKEFVEDLWEKQEGVCYYSFFRDDCPVEMQVHKRKKENGCTVERLDNTLGHLKSNVVLACSHCNNRSSHTQFWQ